VHVHGNNITQKIGDFKKYNDEVTNQYLSEIKIEYEKWKAANLSLIGPSVEATENDADILRQRVKLYNDYKNFIDQQHYAEKFDSRSNLHSSVLEEFIYYLFKDLVGSFSSEALIGKSHAFKDMFFMSKNYREMLKRPTVKLEKKDHDFIIGVFINASLTCNGSNETETLKIQVPAVAIECKTYLGNR
jgi:hypothetical protein